MFKERKTKPKYSIRKYSIGAASALIGFMALANGQAAQADEAQTISDLTDASNQAQTPQTASKAQLATSEPASVETVQASQPASCPDSASEAHLHYVEFPSYIAQSLLISIRSMAYLLFAQISHFH